MFSHDELIKLNDVKTLARKKNCFVAVKQDDFLLYRKGEMRNILIIKTKSLPKLEKVIKNQ